jgi:hypothetical protein
METDDPTEAVSTELGVRQAAGALAPPGDVSRNDGAAAEEDLPAEVQEAHGVLSARLGVTTAEAGGVLRTVSHCAGTPLIAVARHVLANRGSVD